MFRTYFSNVPLGTGHNFILDFPQDTRLHCRTCIRPTVGGTFPWRFWFSNCVDSTYDRGQSAYVGRPGGCWKILRAQVGCVSDPKHEPMRWTPITFGGMGTKQVLPGEVFWSDEHIVSVPNNYYLVWDWIIEGNHIPCTPDSQAITLVDDGAGLCAQDACPMPDLFGCKRTVNARIAFLGDSITQGCQTGRNAYAMWAGRIAFALGETCVSWNLGLGFGRGSDAATDGSWLYKAKQSDTVCLCFGINDLLHGAYRSTECASAQSVLQTLRTLTETLRNNDIRVILFTVPPFDLPDAIEKKRLEINAHIPALCREYDAVMFDFASVLSDTLDPRHALYGPHPDGNGGKAAAEDFLKMNFFEVTT